jgi:hypothetical protein
MFLTSKDVILYALSITTPLGCNEVGLIMLTDVGVPNSYLVTLDPVGIVTLIDVPLASTSSKLEYSDKSISSVNPVQPYIQNVIRFLTLDKSTFTIFS